MSYNNNIPLLNDYLSVSQPMVRTNFAQLDTIAQVNHFELTTANKGKHNQVNLPEEKGSIPSTSTDEMCIYTQNLTTGNEPELMLARESSASKGAIPLSRYPVLAAGSFASISGTGNASIRTEFPPTNVADPVVVGSSTVYPVLFTNALASAEYVVHVWRRDTLTENRITTITTKSYTTAGFTISGSSSTSYIYYFIVVGGLF